METKVTNIDEYIAGFPESTREILEKIRRAIADVAPGATETISYGIPTFDMNKKNLVHFAGYENHIGFYPTPRAIEEFKNELKQYKISKGTIQFPIDKPMPIELIQKITKYRVGLIT